MALMGYNGAHMGFSSETAKTDTLLVLFGLSFIAFGWFAFSLALGSLFLFPFIAGGAVLSGAMAMFIVGKLLLRAPLDFRIAILALLLFASLIGYVSEPTLFSGRDQGSIAEAAFRLAHDGQLAFSTPASDSFF